MNRTWEITYEYLFIEYAEDGEMTWETDQEVTQHVGTKEDCFDYILEILKENVDFRISSIVDITDEAKYENES